MSEKGSFFENIRVVPKMGAGRTKGDVGCDRMVVATNSDLFLIKFDSFFNEWSLDQGQKTINPLIPPIFPRDRRPRPQGLFNSLFRNYEFPHSTLGERLGTMG